MPLAECSFWGKFLVVTLAYNPCLLLYSSCHLVAQVQSNYFAFISVIYCLDLFFPFRPIRFRLGIYNNLQYFTAFSCNYWCMFCALQSKSMIQIKLYLILLFFITKKISSNTALLQEFRSIYKTMQQSTINSAEQLSASTTSSVVHINDFPKDLTWQQRLKP